MKLCCYLFGLLFLVPCFVRAQDSLTNQNIDALYREDQIYLGVNVNFLNTRPKGVVTESLFGGFHLGFLRDMPINKRRNLAFAIGLGYAYNSYGHNLLVTKDNLDATTFLVLDDTFDYTRNRFETHEIEVPLELRWRTSTDTTYKFWRIYGGVKLGYLFYFSAVLKNNEGKFKTTNVDALDKLRYTAFLNFGYDVINFQVQYNLNSFFNNKATLNGSPVDMTAFKLGFIFYIL